MYFELEAIKQQVQQAINAIASGSAPGANLTATNMCPISLMAVGDTCLDFYIAAPTALGILQGNGRGPDPYAGVNQSKFQFVPKFNENKFHLLVSGTGIAVNIPLPSGSQWTWTPVSIYVPANPWQIQQFRIAATSPTRRVVTFKVVNADCGLLTGVLQGQNLPASLLGGLIAAACPAIDAEVVYEQQGTDWAPTSYIRDSYPTLDVWKKTASGFSLLRNSRESSPGGLLGLQQLMGKIQNEQNELLNDPACQLQ